MLEKGRKKVMGTQVVLSAKAESDLCIHALNAYQAFDILFFI